MISSKPLVPGIWKYTNVFKKEDRLIERLENAISSSNGLYSWENAAVGYDEIIHDYRNCADFKLGRFDGKEKDKYIDQFDSIWKDICDSQRPAVEDYCKYHTIDMKFWDWVNVVKYGEGQFFNEHADHGFSYVSTVSLVGYPNNDYVGGELYFPKIGLSVKPEAGDLYIFPSSYIYSHVAMPVSSGIKYAFVTMLDYNDYAHTAEFEEYVNRKNGVLNA